MDELIDIVDIQGCVTGNTCLKSFAHKKGILHASVHVWIYDKEGQILVQKRSPNKEIYPNLWDVSVAGHIATKEQPWLAALRETKEEIGLNLTKEQLEYCGIWTEKHLHSNGLIDHEVHHIYLTELSTPLDKLSMQKEEVADLKLISLTELKQQYIHSNVFVPRDEAYYKHIFQLLSEA
ncbi:NUDIX hydrolase [Wenyingzhuangia sp. IMCC45533]